MTKQLTRWLGALIALVGAAGLLVAAIATTQKPFASWPAFDTTSTKLIAHYSYFTIWSNIAGTIAGITYALGWASRSTLLLKVLRIDASMMLIVTGLVYNIVLRTGEPDQGSDIFTNPVLHIFMPIAVPLVWVLSMPLRRDRDITVPTVARALIIPAVWTVWTFIHGVSSGGYYPYGFMNPVHLGYPVALRNLAFVYVLFFVLIGLLSVVEKLMSARAARAR